MTAADLLTDWSRRFGVDDLEQFLDPAPAVPQPAQKRTVPYIGPERPGDAYNARHTGSELLQQLGFTLHSTNREGEFWCRPGKERREGHSVVIYADDGHITNYSDTVARMWPWPKHRPMDPFGVYVATMHAGDFRAATRQLSTEGYGERRQADDLSWVTTSAPAPAVAGGEPAEAPVVEDETWPAPEPFDVEVGHGPLFPLEVLPDWIADRALTACLQVSAPIDFAAVTALGALSAITMNRVVLDLSEEQVRQPLNLWVAVGAESGASKSYPFNSMIAPLRQFISLQEQDALEGRVRAEANLVIAQKELDELQKKSTVQSQGSAALGTQLMDAMMKLEMAKACLPADPHFTTGDITPEALASFYLAHGQIAAIASEEGECIDMMAGQYAKQGGDANVRPYICGYDRSPLENSRKTSGTVNVDAPCLTIAVMTQPLMLARLGGHGYLEGKGIVGRFLLCVPPDPRGHASYDYELLKYQPGSEVAVEANRLSTTHYQDTMLALAGRLAKYNYPNELHLKATPEAHRRFVAWKQENEPRLRRGGDLRRMVAWYQKIRTATFRTAALLHLAHHPDLDDLEVNVEDFERAFVLADYWVAHCKVLLKAWADRKAKEEDHLVQRGSALLKWLLEFEGDEDVDGANGKPWRLEQVPLAVITRRLKNSTGLKKSDALDVVEFLVEKGWARVVDGFFSAARAETRGAPRHGIGPLCVAFHPDLEALLDSDSEEAPDLGLPAFPAFSESGDSSLGKRGNRRNGIEVVFQNTTTSTQPPVSYPQDEGSRLQTPPHSVSPIPPLSNDASSVESMPQIVADHEAAAPAALEPGGYLWD